MARQLRIEYPGAAYHVINRGVERRTIFEEAQEYRRFLDLLAEETRPCRVAVHAYCLMPNHYHLFVQTPEGRLRMFMQRVNARYVAWFNRRRQRVGPLFQGRYRALIVRTDVRVRLLVRYIHPNPVAAGLSERAEDWPWSSCAA